MEFDENPDHAAIRDAVAQVAAPVRGRLLHRARRAARSPPPSCGRRSAARVHRDQHPRGVRRRRRRPDRAGARVRGDRRRGRPAAPAAGVAARSAARSSPATAASEQKKAWLPGMATGQRKVVFAITEPDAGSNTHQLVDDGAAATATSWVLRGTKYYISGVDEADALIVVARTGTDPAAPARGGCRCSWCRRTAPGLVAHRAAGVRVAAGEAVHALLRRRPA